MMKPQLHAHHHVNTRLFLHRSTISCNKNPFSFRNFPVVRTLRRWPKTGRILSASGSSSAVETTTTEKTITVKAIVTVKLSLTPLFTNVGLNRGLDYMSDLLGNSVLLELVSAELDPQTGLEKEIIEGFVQKLEEKDGLVKYEGEFEVPNSFGEIGAVLVTNDKLKEMFFKDIVLTGFTNSPITITCNSWVHAKKDNPKKRIFFTNKMYLPSQTPKGLRKLRKKELEILRGNGLGRRNVFDRIYDYDMYNDLGQPDEAADLARPVLGGKVHPYPRRCRTGRPPTKNDQLSERRTSNRESPYLPRDEAFSEAKQLTIWATMLKSVPDYVLPSLESVLKYPKLDFPFVTGIDSMVNDELTLGDKFSWFRDEEFARHTLAGINPFSIQLVTEFPLESKLDEEIYGPKESSITKEIIEQEMRGALTIEEALERKKLFMLDYHDLYLPYVHKVRELDGTTLYGSRTIFFRTEGGTLQPIAIELTRPASPTKPQWKQVFTPSSDATNCWLWRIAKTHVATHDSGYHQLVNHWLRTHCCMEPYVIAANRQLSIMHPINRLLHPHFRCTMATNSIARQVLINAEGVIESNFFPGKYSMELSSVAYDKQWRFDHQALPADLINRGMAVEDPTTESGVKLVIDDYPFANDGLLIWSSLKAWVNDYVTYFYPDSDTVLSDEELQSWWFEVKTKGHADKKDEPWWPLLNTPADLTHIITTIIWVASGHHAAVNFGQNRYGGYIPNRPTIARKEMPVEDITSEEFSRFLRTPKNALLNTLPTQMQATQVMAYLDVLSTHSPDEEYLGGEPDQWWCSNPTIKAAFDRFSDGLKVIEGIIEERNSNLAYKNRAGAGVVPYELLKPFSKAGGVGKMGVPNSVST